MFFNMFQLEKQNTPVDKMMQSTYLCVILHVKHKKITSSFCFYEISISG